MDEITIPRDELARDLRIHMNVLRQKKPHLLRNLAALKDNRGYPDHDREAAALTAFADDIADWMALTGKRIVRGRSYAIGGGREQTNHELGIEPDPSKQLR